MLEVGCARANDSLKIRTVIALLATTGLRLTECMSLKRDGVDPEARELKIAGKGNKRRVVPLLEWTANMLADYIGERRSDSPFIFPGNTRTGYAEIYNVEKTLKRACLRAGVEPFTPHQLRHLYATEMLRSGAYGVIILNDSTTTATAQTRICLISYIFEWISSTTKVPV
ncbi:MAG TPA: tyrosine-type recombinase/integrase [Dehalococcoidales bacterium]|nr:tyrosine-type recombinase/integrase [Dehalococcoidales bacterium]